MLIEPIALLAAETPDFISPTFWSPNSPDLNPVDYKIWAAMQEMVYKQKIRNVDELQKRTVESCDHLDQSIIDSAISQWRTQLQACVKESDGHIEHRLWLLYWVFIEKLSCYDKVTNNLLVVSIPCEINVVVFSEHIVVTQW